MSDRPAGMPVEHERHLVALTDLIGRTGAKSLQIRYSDDEQPVVWMAVAQYQGGRQVAADFDPLGALLRLAERLIDGGQCTHCGRMSLLLDWREETPPLLEPTTCAYAYDPELHTYRRSCE